MNTEARPSVAEESPTELLALATMKEMTAAASNDLAAMSLDELAERANVGARDAVAAAWSSLGFAIVAGDALIEARERVRDDGGAWKAWLAENFDAPSSTAYAMMRIAHYRDEVMQAADSGELRSYQMSGPSWGAALKYLRTKPQTDGRPVGGYPESVRADAVALFRSGLTRAQVAGEMGIDRHVVGQWVNPSLADKKRERERMRDRERQRANVALRRQARDRAMKQMGGDTAACYSLIRKAAQKLDATCCDATDPEVRAALTAALSNLHRVEDEIVRALGVE